MSNQMQAFIYVAKGFAVMLLSGFAMGMALNMFGITKTAIFLLLVGIVYGLYMLYKMELDRLNRIEEIKSIK